MSVTKAGSTQAPGGQGCQQRGCGKPGKSRQRRKLGLFAPRGSEPQWRASAGGGAAVRAGELRVRETESRAGHLALGWDRT